MQRLQHPEEIFEAGSSRSAVLAPPSGLSRARASYRATRSENQKCGEENGSSPKSDRHRRVVSPVLFKTPHYAERIVTAPRHSDNSPEGRSPMLSSSGNSIRRGASFPRTRRPRARTAADLMPEQRHNEPSRSAVKRDRWKPRSSELTSVVPSDDGREYEGEYGLVSAICSSLQFASASTRGRCRQFQLSTACRIGSGGTFNPKVAGSNPARPIFARWLSRSRSTMPARCAA